MTEHEATANRDDADDGIGIELGDHTHRVRDAVRTGSPSAVVAALKALDWQTIWLVAIVCIAVSMVVAAMAALNTALPSIAEDIDATAGQQTWILDGYTLALAALLLPAGALGDRIGRRGVMIAGLLLFSVASLLAIFVDGPVQLIGTRILAGAAAALVMPTTLSLITSNVPENKRALSISIWSAVAGVGAIAGFFVSGILLQFFSWKSIFITFAASAAVTALICLTIGTSKDSDPHRFDWPGTITSVLGVFGVVFGLLEVPTHGWTNPVVLISLIGGLVLLAAFVLIELRLPTPLLNVRLFTNRAFGGGSLSVLLQFFASFAIFFLILQQLQLVFGYSALKSAVALFPLLIGTGVFSLVGNYLAVRFHSLRFVVGFGVFLAGLGILLMGLIDYDSYWVLATFLFISATGIGLAAAPSTTAIMSNTPLDDQGVGSAVNDTARELGAAIGIALTGSLVAAGYGNLIGPTADAARSALGNPATGGNAEAGAQAAEGITNSLAGATKVAESITAQASAPGVPAEQASHLQQLAHQISEGANAAFISPMQTSCLILGVMLIVGAGFLTWFTPRRIVPEVVDAS